MPQRFEVRAIHEMSHIAFAAREIVVHTQDVVSFVDELFTEV